MQRRVRHGSLSRFPEAAEMAAVNRQFDVGVHLTLNSEKRPYRWRPLTAPSRETVFVPVTLKSFRKNRVVFSL
jgi:hypothetical protein